MATKTVPPPPGGAIEPNWTAIENSREFRSLVNAKMRFIIPALVFFVVYYFALPVLVGYFPGVMERNVVGHINLAYVFALSQFAMVWIIMALYVRSARSFDAQEAQVIDAAKRGTLS